MQQSAITIDHLKSNKWVANAFVQAFAGGLFIALCAQIKIPLLFTPIPLTLQTFAVMLMGAVLGKRCGVLTVLSYLVLSASGLPVMSGGTSSPWAIIGPAGGYLIGMVAQAYIIGYLCERFHNKSVIFLGMIGACCLQLALGSFWLASFVGMDKMFIAGFFPFIPGEFIKVLCVYSCVCAKKFNSII